MLKTLTKQTEMKWMQGVSKLRKDLKEEEMEVISFKSLFKWPE